MPVFNWLNKYSYTSLILYFWHLEKLVSEVGFTFVFKYYWKAWHQEVYENPGFTAATYT